MPQNVGLLATRSPGPPVGPPLWAPVDPFRFEVSGSNNGVYVKSGATGNASGSSWANAYVDLQTALNNAAAGLDIWVSNNHSEALAGPSYVAAAGTQANPYRRIICVDDTKVAPFGNADLRTTAAVGSFTNSQIQINGCGQFYGIKFLIGSGASSNTLGIANAGSTTSRLQFINCQFGFNSTGAASVITIGQASTVVGSFGRVVEMINCTWVFTNAAHFISFRGTKFTCRGGSLSGTAPSVLVSPATGANEYQGLFLMDGVDLSTVAGTLVGLSTGNMPVMPTIYSFTNCKLNAAVTALAAAAAGSAGYTGGDVILAQCDSAGGATNWRSEKHNFVGDMTTDNVVVETGGASDGVTTISHKVVTKATANFVWPFEAYASGVWNAVTGSTKVFSVDILSDGPTLTNADVWLECMVLDATGAPRSTLYTSQNGVYAPPTTIPDSPSTVAWTTTGLVLPRKQTISLTFTPQIAGYIRWQIKVGKPNQTLWINPKPLVV